MEKTLEQLIKEIEQLKDKISMLEKAAYKRDATVQSLLKSEERLKQILKNSNHWIWEVDSKGMYTYTNDVLADQLGYVASEIIGKKYFYDFFHVKDRDRLKEEALNIFKQKKTFYNFINLNMSKNGEEVWLSTSGVPFLDNKGELLGYRGVDIDITQNVLADTKIKESEDRYRFIFQNNWDGIITIDPIEHKIIDFNDKACSILGFTREEFIARSIEGRMVAPDVSQLIERSIKALKISASSSFETKHLNKDGSLVYREVKAEIFEHHGKGLILAIFRDITERKKSEQALIDSKNQLNLIINKLPGRIAYIDSNEEYLHVNKAYADSFNFSQESIIGKKLNFVLSDNSYKSIKKDIQRVLAGEEVIHENVSTDTDNKVKILLAKYIPHFDEYGIVIAFLTTLEDITERKQAESALVEAYKIINRSPAVAFLWKAENNWPVDYVSENVMKLFGYPAKEFTEDKLHYKDFIHSDDIKRFNKEVEAWSKLKDTNSFSHKPYRIVAKNGDIKWIDDKTYIRKDANGKITHYEGIVYDVSERKEAENVRLKLNSAINNSSEVIFMTDIEGTINFINDEFTKMYGYSSEEVIGKTTPRILNSRHHQKEEHKKLWDTLLNKQSISISQYINKCKNGEFITVEASANPIIDDNGEIIGFLAIQRDITKRKKSEQNLIEALEKAKESDRLKSAFLANMSHEIRTPINGILGFANLLQNPGLKKEEIYEFANIIVTSGNRMLNTINDLVDIAKIESGQIEVVNTKFDICNLMDELITFYKPAAEKKKLSLILKNSDLAKQVYIHSDRQKVYSILSNLLINAIKYTHKGNIEFAYRLLGKTSEKTSIEFIVKDTGIGISTDKHQLIFDRFIRANIDNKTVYEGSGLGLSISKAFAELLNGEISVKSEIGLGSEFCFRMPIITPIDSNIEDEKLILDNKKIAKLKKLKVLIADDDKIGQKLLSHVLKSLSREIILANNGQEAIEIFENNPDLDLILMDMRMPLMDGYLAVSKIRELNKDVVIIAQTGFALSGDREKSIEAGCTDYITKPIDKNILFNKIYHYLS